MSDLLARVDRLAADAQERRKKLREQEPEAAAFIDEYRRVFPGCKFRNWTVEGKPV